MRRVFASHKTHSKFSARLGFGILEVLVALAIMGLGLVALVQMQQNMSKGQKFVATSMDIDSLRASIRMMVSSEMFCGKGFTTLANHTAPTTITAGGPAMDLGRIQMYTDATHNDILAEAGVNLSPHLMVTSIQLIPIPPPIVPPQVQLYDSLGQPRIDPVTLAVIPPLNQVLAKISITFSRDNGVSVGAGTVKDESLRVALLTDPTTNLIYSCHVPSSKELMAPLPITPPVTPPLTAPNPVDGPADMIFKGIIPMPKGCHGGYITASYTFPPNTFVDTPVVIAQPRFTTDNASEHSDWLVFGVSSVGFTFQMRGPHDCGSPGQSDIMFTAIGTKPAAPPPPP